MGAIGESVECMHYEEDWMGYLLPATAHVSELWIGDSSGMFMYNLIDANSPMTNVGRFGLTMKAKYVQVVHRCGNIVDAYEHSNGVWVSCWMRLNIYI